VDDGSEMNKIRPLFNFEIIDEIIDEPNLQFIIDKARKLKIDIRVLIIREIQKQEGYPQCYKTNQNCSQQNCCWRSHCLVK